MKMFFVLSKLFWRDVEEEMVKFPMGIHFTPVVHANRITCEMLHKLLPF